MDRNTCKRCGEFLHGEDFICFKCEMEITDRTFGWSVLGAIFLLVIELILWGDVIFSDEVLPSLAGALPPSCGLLCCVVCPRGCYIWI